ncbi:peptide chain release factor 2 [candidate division WOR-1 bacterium RIFOXYA2_FULL_36_21]|uniref:Peptide chain release factor 2 n=1 Tax=candidate division WOR-1 bacterium RIFOXYB2_FULL_36_35 TaxID=1802578 RepID=A0A1F4S3W2_UNCSA|nr:MAG: peptide chain release factor 2 [candidate division WOR-1 bacterium RIFOXYA2_FULL_36_21]OGC15090.1 MAG: peptide chain release factor 2 [candidate division WOR-1 bacterium RIFOXYB2_FULL_36_35]OGC18837.1 MAG: peptide chain release factor 2 [candidate division WOR-1 bacterium RIFOXYA12_FULL_36_13]
MLDDLKKEIQELSARIDKIKEFLQVDTKQIRISELQKETQSDNLWSNPDKAKKTLQEMKSLEKETKSYNDLRDNFDDIKVLTELASGDKEEAEIRKEFENIKKEIASLEITALLSGAYDQNNAILTIASGAGGTDAQDWAEILFRMYTRWSESKGYSVELADMSYGEEAGIKGATLIISGLYAYGYLKAETGVHRLVRISPFSSEGKRHTSFASVEVAPEVAEDIKVDINPGDLRVDTFRASGPGGQNVNKVSSAIRITHIPTGIVVQSQQQRSQHQNREYAMRILKAKLYEMMLKEHKDKIEELKGERKAIEWGHQIRSYVFQPYTMVKDHRTGVEIGNVQSVIDGEIDSLIEAALKMKI